MGRIDGAIIRDHEEERQGPNGEWWAGSFGLGLLAVRAGHTVAEAFVTLR
jgi:hypothetical protein